MHSSASPSRSRGDALLSTERCFAPLASGAAPVPGRSGGGLSWRRMRRVRWLALLVALAIAGCRSDKAPVGQEPAVEEDAEQARIDQLRSLPYLTYSRKPAGEGEASGVVRYDSARSWPGYNLYVIRGICRADLVDMRGRVVNSWSSTPCQRWAQAELLPEGDLLVVGRATKRSRYLLRLSWQGKVIWQKDIPSHHDIERTPSGALLALTLTNRRVVMNEKGRLIVDNLLALLDESGEVVESRSLFDILSADPAQRALVDNRAREGKANDLLHANSVEWMREKHLFGTSPLYRMDHILVSLRHQDIVAIVDWRQRRLVWWWGRGELSGPHDATLLENGQVLVFDNGLGRGWSRVVQIDPVSNRIVWQYKAKPPESFFSSALGSCQRLPNGNTLIANSESGEAFEVTSEGEVVWKFVTPHQNSRHQRATIVRMKRYDPALVERLLRAPVAG